MANLNKDDLMKVITELFKRMEKNGIFLDPDKKKEITETLAEALDDQLTKDDVKDVDVQKKLLSCISAKVMGDQKGLASLLNLLQSPDKDTPNPGLDLKLKAMLTFIKATLDNKNDPDKKNEFKLTPFETLLKMSKSKDKKKTLEEDKQLEKDMDAYLRNLYGGQNPTMNGEVAFPVLGPIIGNLFGFTNQCSADPTSCAEMVDLITFNAGKLDPAGIENTARLSDLEMGADDIYNVFRPSPHPDPRGNNAR